MLTTVSTGAKLTKLKIGTYGSANAAISANIRPRLCLRSGCVSCFAPLPATIRYTITTIQTA